MSANPDPMIARFFHAGEDVPAAWWPCVYFKPSEVRCKGEGSILVYRPALLTLDRLRAAWGGPLTLTSGYRSLRHNSRVGGAANSLHLQGRAFDINCPAERQDELITKARQVGFTGIGKYATFVHVDDGPIRSWTG